MKIFYILPLLAAISCDPIGSQNHSKPPKVIEVIQCGNEKTFGDISICLPEIEGMNECYSDPKISSMHDELSREKEEIIGIYLSDSDYAKRESYGEFAHDDYFKIYAGKIAKGMKMGKPELDLINDEVGEGFFKERWSDFKPKLDSLTKHVTFDRPVLLESYRTDDRRISQVYLTKLQSDSNENFLVMVLNMVLIKERLIFYAYYKEYDGEKSIKQAKAKSDYFGARITDENQ
ncbi:hypothetical protein G3O08_06160 [Cryomorpha ignava]|uniref:Uncharacterized protein n=1 Tax=Cryomorpha ignava TaxID=101383 RepID=A0A7K3WPX8_9FLAO|nr:hypothetical protein [Cryomorpha ignava]NEN23081.1 hypothetical protein [Cryomorpha ignava]